MDKYIDISLSAYSLVGGRIYPLINIHVTNGGENRSLFLFADLNSSFHIFGLNVWWILHFIQPECKRAIGERVYEVPRLPERAIGAAKPKCGLRRCKILSASSSGLSASLTSSTIRGTCPGTLDKNWRSYRSCKPAIAARFRRFSSGLARILTRRSQRSGLALR